MERRGEKASEKAEIAERKTPEKFRVFRLFRLFRVFQGFLIKRRPIIKRRPKNNEVSFNVIV